MSGSHLPLEAPTSRRLTLRFPISCFADRRGEAVVRMPRVLCSLNARAPQVGTLMGMLASPAELIAPVLRLDLLARRWRARFVVHTGPRRRVLHAHLGLQPFGVPEEKGQDGPKSVTKPSLAHDRSVVPG
jgi:hypothetical protein